MNTLSLNCNAWLQVNELGSAFVSGDLDITGNQLTIEAVFNRTKPYTGSTLYAGDLVSKHSEPVDCNYLLRPNSAEITTTNGYYITPPICEIELNRTYHVAMVYDGASLRFYRNGFLMGEVACTGNLVTNDFPLTIGQNANDLFTLPEEFLLGYISEVRIWNVARTQSDLKNFMQQALPSPPTQVGLLAYYQFDDLRNKQGNPAWDGRLTGQAAISRTNPVCLLAKDSCNMPLTAVNADFTLPDTVCVNEPVQVVNKTTGGSSFYWNFCLSSLSSIPEAVNLGNTGGLLQGPVFSDFAESNGKYHLFVVNNFPGGLVRLDFGNSMLNAPAATFLGNFNGAISDNAEGIQLVQVDGNWIAIIVGGYPAGGTSSRILKLEFGPDISNPNPVVTNWGNIGNMNYPIDLHLFKEGNNWYGFTLNSENQTITRFEFGPDFSGTPIAVNIGNIGNLLGPTGIFAINDKGSWRVFITNATDNPSLTRLDFGNSLLNIPTAVNLGNLGNTLKRPRDIYIMNFCGETVGFLVNGAADANNLLRLSFKNGLDSEPEVLDLGNPGNMNFPHSISRLFRVGTDLFSFVTNVGNNSITRLRFAGCEGIQIPNSTAFSPGLFSYDKPGTYNVNLLVDEGLPSQAAVCKTITVLGNVPFELGNDTSICETETLVLGPDLQGDSYTWNTGETSRFISISQTGTYYLDIEKRGCTYSDTIQVNVIAAPVFDLGPDTSVCTSDTYLLKSPITADNYLWSTGSNADAIGVDRDGQYKLTVTSNGCSFEDSLVVRLKPFPQVDLGPDTFLCEQQAMTLDPKNPGEGFLWNTGSQSPTLTVNQPGTYSVTVTSEGCSASDTINISSRAKPTISLGPDLVICVGQPYSFDIRISGGRFSSWENGQTDPERIISGPGTYIASAVNDCGVSYDTLVISGGGTADMLYKVANAFSPNGDGRNDCFGISRWVIRELKEFSIYNRLGQRIFSGSAANRCWDGTLNGTQQPSGGYIYVIRAETSCGPVYRKGMVMLVR